MRRRHTHNDNEAVGARCPHRDRQQLPLPRRPHHISMMACPTDGDASRVRKPVELIQRFPRLSVHEELMDVTLDFIGDRRCLGPSPMELYFGGCSHNERTVTRLERINTVDRLLTNTVSRLATVDIDFARVKHLEMDDGGDDGTTNRRRYQEYLLSSSCDDDEIAVSTVDDDRFEEDDDAGDVHLAEKRSRTEDPHRTTCNNSFQGSGSDSGLHGANVAITTAPSLRNVVSISMPRRVHRHKSVCRLCVVPIVSLECGDPALGPGGGGLPSMVYLRRVVDRALARELEHIDSDDACPATLKAASVLQAMDASDDLVRSLKRQRTSIRGTEQLLLDERPMLLGCNLSMPIEDMTDDDLRTHVTTVLHDCIGTLDGFFTLRLLTMHYMRQRMMDPLDGIDGTTQGPGQDAFVALGGAVLPSMEAVRAAHRAKEEHLRHCGIVDVVEFYSTVVAFALVQDPIFATALREEGGPVAVNNSKMGAFSRPPEAVSIPHALAVHSDGGGGAAAGDSAATWYTYQLEVLPNANGVLLKTGDCRFCCSRESFELAMVVTHLREAYLTVLVEHLVRVVRRRCAAVPALRCYEHLSGSILASYRTAKFTSPRGPNDASAEASTKHLQDMERETVQQLWALQQEKRFAVLFLPFDVLDGEVDSSKVDCADDDGDDEIEITEVCPKSLKLIRPPCVPQPHLVVYLLRQLRYYWQVASHRPFPAARLRDALMACGVSFVEANELMVQISLDAQQDSTLAFEWRSSDVYMDNEAELDDDDLRVEDVRGTGGERSDVPSQRDIKHEVKMEPYHRSEVETQSQPRSLYTAVVKREQTH